MKKTGNPKDDIQERFAQYEELVVERDRYAREATSYMVAYTREFGDMITSNIELQIECIKKKKTISYCRRRLNRGLPIDTSRMQKEIESEMKLYYVRLKEMAESTEEAKKAKPVETYRFLRCKKMYHKLAKLIHPDINKRTEENETLKELWNRITEAYNSSDLDALEDTEVLVRKALEELGDEGFEIETSNIEERIERVEREINEILSTAPYTYGELLSNEEKKESLKEVLREEHRNYEDYLESLTQVLDEMLSEGEVRIIWKPET